MRAIDEQHIFHLRLAVREPARLFVEAAAKWCADNGFYGFGITDSIRDIYEQAGRWSQGRVWHPTRKEWEIVNEGKVVTRTLDSAHLEGRAIDVAPLMHGGFPYWPDPETKDGLKFWLKIADLGESYRFSAGARWKKPDYPHFEMPKEKL